MEITSETGRVFRVTPQAGETLGMAIWLSGETPPAALCSGLGRCGRCRVRLEGGPLPEPLRVEQQVLGEQAVAEGWRLACRHEACAVETLGGAGLRVMLPLRTGIERPSPVSTAMVADGERLLLAVDLGTTSLAWQVLESSGRVIALGSQLNPQMGAGSDVVTRIAVAVGLPASTPTTQADLPIAGANAIPDGNARAAEGRGRLRRLVIDALVAVVQDTEHRFGQAPTELVVAGNTAMTSILLDKDCTGLAAAPYRLPEAGGRQVSLPGLPPTWIPPQPAPFVGGDLSAGMAALLSEAPLFPFLLADLGTNGEFALALDAEHALLASVPLGPSLEGIGLSRGAVAGPGVVTSFDLRPAGLVPCFFAGSPPEGEAAISGTGYLSLIDCLRRAGLLSVEGTLHDTALTPLGRRLRAAVVFDVDGWRLPLPCGLELRAQDVEELLKVRAAFVVALRRLLDEAGLSAGALREVVIAGALGQHMPDGVLERLGFLPPGLGGRLRAAGNTSLSGAALLARDLSWRTRIMDWAAGCRTLNLTGDPRFLDWYVGALRFGD